uniref:glycosyltransferase n=1 Tax=Desulfococcus sp. TaxID=2025834 RepID=UPI00359335A9
AAAAFGRVAGKGRLEIFTGPFMPADWAGKIAGFSGERIRVSTFTADFLSFLAAADLSVSMAGYNTCMNVMAAGCPALLWPFSQNREQRLRAERLAGLGAVRVLTDGDLAPRRLADLMAACLAGRDGRDAARRRPPLDLEGAQASARWLAEWMNL